jgi:hypothetical protein
MKGAARQQRGTRFRSDSQQPIPRKVDGLAHGWAAARLAHILLVLVAVLPAPASAQPQTGRPLIGAYVWGGLLNGKPTIENFHDSVKFVLDHGFEAVRFAVTPGSLPSYGVPSCAATDQMRCALKSLLDAPVFDDARLKLVVITLHDFSFGQRPMVDAEFLEQHRAALVQEYRAGLAAVSERFANRNTTVVISNWEGDNVVYCGSVYRFATAVRFAAECQGQATGNIERRMQGLVAWLKLRSELVDEVRRDSPPLTLLHAPEVNNVVLFEHRCRHQCDPSATVFGRLGELPGLRLCSYSAYDSVRENLLATALARLSAVCPTVILGEVGIRTPDVSSAEADKRAKAVIDQVRGASVKVPLAIIVWNAFEARASRDAGYGLFEEDGRPRTFRFWREMLPSRSSPPPP